METLSIVFMNWRDIRNPDSGGAEVFVHEVAKRWAQAGHRLTLLTSRYENSIDEESIDGVRVIRQGTRLSVYRRARRTYLQRFLHDSDVLIDVINTRPFLSIRYAGRRTLVLALIFQLAREFWNYETPFPINYVGRYWLEDHWLRAYHQVPTVTISASTRTDLHAIGFEDVTVVRPGVSVAAAAGLPEKDPDPTLIYVGRLKKAKFPDHALRAFTIIKERLPAARLWIVGEGYMAEALKRESPSGVTFFGRVSEREKVDLLRRAHLLLYPAVREGWGLTILEANAVGTPAVGYDVPGLRDSIQNHRTGVLVPFGAIPMLAAEALLLLTDPERRGKMARAALEWAESLSWEATAREFFHELTRRLGSYRFVTEKPIPVRP